MSLHDELDMAADFADILAYQQRAAMLATQAAQLDALRGIQYQAQIQSLRAERERALQDTLFALRKSLPSILLAVDNNPGKALESLFNAERTMMILPATEFSGLEWKELSATVRDEMTAIVKKLGEAHGESIPQKLSDMLDEARQSDEEKRNEEARAEWIRQDDLTNKKQLEGKIKDILSGFNILIFFALVVTIALFWNHALICSFVLVAEITGAVVFNVYKLRQIR